MTETPDWFGMEQEMARLFPDGVAPDRPLLLAKLGAYAAAAVRQARFLGAVAPEPAARARALAWLERPVFVCGHHRTGTTLLRDLLDGHPELHVLPGEATYLFSFRYAARVEVPPATVDRLVTEWICRYVDPNLEPHFLLGRSQDGQSPSVWFARRLFGWHAALRDTRPGRAGFAPLLALAAAFGNAAAATDQPRLWVEKTPLNERHAKLLARTFPEARFIQLVREPLATLASLIQVSPSSAADGPSSFRHAWTIRRSLRLAARNRQRLAPRYLVVRYEDLTAAPRDEMERVRAFLGIAPSPALATPTVLGNPVRSNSSFRRDEAGVVVRPSAAPPPLATEAAELIRAFVASPARPFGYDVAALPMVRRATLSLREVPRYALERLLATRHEAGPR